MWVHPPVGGALPAAAAPPGGVPRPRPKELTTLFPPLANHSFKKIEFQPPEAKKFFSTVRKEMALLATSLPDGIMVKTFEDRMASSRVRAGPGDRRAPERLQPRRLLTGQDRLCRGSHTAGKSPTRVSRPDGRPFKS